MRPCMTCTNFASFLPPPNSVSIREQPWKVTSFRFFSISAHHSPCSGRALFLAAASGDSKRTSTTNLLSSVTPSVTPR